MSSLSSSKRTAIIAKTHHSKMLNIPLTKAPHVIRFLCVDLSSDCQTGVLRLPKEFAVQYQQLIPNTVYLRLPNGCTWFGTYVAANATIKNLENFMCFYDIKPYTMIGFEYCGGSDFLIEIFNCYAVEIDYGPKKIPLEFGAMSHNHLGSYVLNLNPPSAWEIEKFSSTLYYNLNSTWTRAYKFFILPKHVRKQKYCQVLTMEVCLQIGLNPTMTWIELGFTTLTCRIDLMWEGENVYFSKEWFKFIENSSIKPGDLCLLRYTTAAQKFKVAIMEQIGTCSISRNVQFQGKGISKFVKMMNHETVLTGEMEIPRVFELEFGWMLCEDIKLVMCDGYEYKVSFLEGSKLVIGLLPMLRNYLVKENYILCFEFLGRSTFYVSIYCTDGMDIFNYRSERLLLQSVVNYLENDVIVLTESTIRMDTEQSGSEIQSADSKILCKTESENGGTISFTRILKASNLKKNGHGVYLAAGLFDIYKEYQKSDFVMLLRDGLRWDVGVYRFKKQCRFGKGWIKFVGDNNFQVGDKLKFTHIGGHTFHVSEANVL